MGWSPSWKPRDLKHTKAYQALSDAAQTDVFVGPRGATSTSINQLIQEELEELKNQEQSDLGDLEPEHPTR